MQVGIKGSPTTLVPLEAFISVTLSQLWVRVLLRITLMITVCSLKIRQRNVCLATSADLQYFIFGQ